MKNWILYMLLAVSFILAASLGGLYFWLSRTQNNVTIQPTVKPYTTGNTDAVTNSTVISGVLTKSCDSGIFSIGQNTFPVPDRVQKDLLGKNITAYISKNQTPGKCGKENALGSVLNNKNIYIIGNVTCLFLPEDVFKKKCILGIKSQISDFNTFANVPQGMFSNILGKDLVLVYGTLMENPMKYPNELGQIDVSGVDIIKKYEAAK